MITRLTRLLVALLLLTVGTLTIWAEKELTPELRKLTDEAYQLYSSRETGKYLIDIQKIKAATENSGYDETFYRACSYEAMYVFE